MALNKKSGFCWLGEEKALEEEGKRGEEKEMLREHRRKATDKEKKRGVEREGKRSHWGGGAEQEDKRVEKGRSRKEAEGRSRPC